MNTTESFQGVSENTADHFLSEKRKRAAVICVLAVILLAGVGINLRMVYKAFTMPKRKREKPAQILITHLSTTAIVYAFFTVFMMADRIDALDLKGPVLCPLISFLHSLLLGLFSMNVTGLVYERFHTFNCFNEGSILIARMLALIWLTSGVFSFPTILTKTFKNSSELESGSSECVAVSLFHQFWLTIVDDVLRFVVFYLSPVVYITCAMYRIRRQAKKLARLKSHLNTGMTRKIQNIKYIYFHFISFIAVWLPYGCFHLTFRIADRLPNQSGNLRYLAYRILPFLVAIYLIVNPTIYLYLIESTNVCLCSVFKNLHGREDTSNGDVSDRNQPKRITMSNVNVSKEAQDVANKSERGDFTNNHGFLKASDL